MHACLLRIPKTIKLHYHANNIFSYWRYHHAGKEKYSPCWASFPAHFRHSLQGYFGSQRVPSCTCYRELYFLLRHSCSLASTNKLRRSATSYTCYSDFWHPAEQARVFLISLGQRQTLLHLLQGYEVTQFLYTCHFVDTEVTGSLWLTCYKDVVRGCYVRFYRNFKTLLLSIWWRVEIGTIQHRITYAKTQRNVSMWEKNCTENLSRMQATARRELKLPVPSKCPRGSERSASRWNQ